MHILCIFIEFSQAVKNGHSVEDRSILSEDLTQNQNLKKNFFFCEGVGGGGGRVSDFLGGSGGRGRWTDRRTGQSCSLLRIQI